ncbi:MAG: hypothetical protein R2876_04920 [Eubacteriales bacterium]
MEKYLSESSDIGITRENRRLYIVSAGEDTILGYDEDLNLSDAINLKSSAKIQPKRIAWLNGYLYTANSADGSICKINALTKEIKRVSVCPYPTDIVAADKRIIICCGETDTILSLDEGLNVINAVPACSFPISMAIDSKKQKLAAACLYNKKIRIYDTKTLEHIDEIDLKEYPNAVAFMDEFILAACSEEGYLTQGNFHFIKDGSILKSIKVNKMPSCVCVASNGNIFVANTGNRSVDIISSKEKKLIKRIQTPEMPDFLINFNKGVYLSCIIDGYLIRMDEDGNIQKKIRTLSEPRGMCIASL